MRMRMSSKKKNSSFKFPIIPTYSNLSNEKMGPWLYRGVWELPNLYGDLYHKSWHFQDPHETKKPRLVELTEVE